jgi:glutathione S-transferase
MSPTLVVHHLRVSQSERIVWLCEELEIDYDLRTYDRDAKTLLAPAEYKDFSPLRTSPVIEDIDTYVSNPEKVQLAESQACMEWIVRKYGQGRLINKPWDAHWKEWLFWWHFTNGSLQPMLQLRLLAAQLPNDSPGLSIADERIQHYLHLIEERLAKSKFLVGDDFTAADIMIVFPLTTMRAFVPMDLSSYPNILKYLQEIGERPAYKKAMEKGQPNWKPMLEANPPPYYSTSSSP